MKEVEDLIADLPGDEKVIAVRLRSLIREADPRVQEKLSYGVPYYFHYRAICFIWPASLLPVRYTPKQPITTKVTLGFCYGNLLSNEQAILDGNGRKQVSTVSFTTPSEINDQVIGEIIREAIMIDDDFKKNKKSK